MKKIEFEKHSKDNWDQYEFQFNQDNVNFKNEFVVNEYSIQSLNSRLDPQHLESSNYSIDNITNITSSTPLQSQRNLLDHNSLIDTLKESIKSNVKSMKKFKEMNKIDQGIRNDSFKNEKGKIKTEKQKIIEHYKNIKTNSRLNLSNTSFQDNTKITSNLYSPNNEILNYEKLNTNIIRSNNHIANQHEDLQLISSGENEFVIFDCFKNMLNKNKKFDRTNTMQKRLSNKLNSDYKERLFYSDNNLQNHIYHNLGVDASNINFPYSNERLNGVQSLNINKGNDEEEFSMIRGLDEEFFPIQNQEDFNQIDEQENFEQKKIFTPKFIEKSKNTCVNSFCKFYKKKFRFFKKSSEEFKKKYLKEKKISEMLNLKIFYENAKSSHGQINIITNSDKMNSTNISRSEEETKFTNMLVDKLQDNNVLFEKLESEISNKDLIINKQNDTISHQKQTIDKLLEQFNIFLSQGNYLINDLLLLKQSMYDKNFKEVSKEFEVINSTINEYTSKIKDFSDKTKNIIIENSGIIKEINNENSQDSNDSKKFEDKNFPFKKKSHENNINSKKNMNLSANQIGNHTYSDPQILNHFNYKLPALNTINEINSEYDAQEHMELDHDTSLNFSLTKSNIRHNQSLVTTENDKSLKLLDLSNKDEDYLN